MLAFELYIALTCHYIGFTNKTQNGDVIFIIQVNKYIFGRLDGFIYKQIVPMTRLVHVMS